MAIVTPTTRLWAPFQPWLVLEPTRATGHRLRFRSRTLVVGDSERKGDFAPVIGDGERMAILQGNEASLVLAVQS